MSPRKPHSTRTNRKNIDMTSHDVSPPNHCPPRYDDTMSDRDEDIDIGPKARVGSPPNHCSSPYSADDSMTNEEEDTGSDYEVDELSKDLAESINLTDSPHSPTSQLPRSPNFHTPCSPTFASKSTRGSVAAAWPWLWLLLPAATVVLAATFWLHLRVASMSVQHVAADLREVKAMLREAFPRQPNASWATFASQLRPLLRDERPDRPAVVLVAGAASSSTLRCLAQRLGGMAAQQLGGTSCRAVAAESDGGAWSRDAEKQAFDVEVRGAYERGERCFYLPRLESLSSQQLLLMHAWCDGDHSPMPRALFLLVLRMEALPENAAAVERFLLQHWGEKVGHDEAGALNTRLGNAVIVVREEDAAVHERSCVNPA